MPDTLLSIIIPVYNEKGTLVEILDKVYAVSLEPGVSKEMIIVDDGSTDGSGALIDEWQLARNKAGSGQSGGPEVVVVHQENGGKGAAVAAGISRSTGDIVIIQDADLEYDPVDYAQCIAPIRDGTAKVVYGSRILDPANKERSSTAFYLGGLAVSFWMNLIYGSRLTDEPTCYKTFDGPLIRTLGFEGRTFDWEPEITGKLIRLGYDIVEVPIKYHPRKVDEGKKISWRDGVVALVTALEWRLRPLGKERVKLMTLPDAADKVRERRRSGRALMWLCLIGLVLRVGVALPGLDDAGNVFSRPDSDSYIQPARALLQTGEYNTAPGSGVPNTLRPPGYSLFLAQCIRLPGNDFVAIALIGCLMSVLTCIPIFKAGRLLGGARVGAVAAGFYVLNITSIAHGPMILSDTLFTFFAAWQFFFFARCMKRPWLMDMLWVIVLAAAGAWVRPIGLAWIAPALVLVMLMPKLPVRKRFRMAFVCAAVFACLITPWMCRNAKAGAGFRFYTNIANTLYYHNCAALISIVNNESAEDLRQAWQAETAAEFASDPVKYADEDSRFNYKMGKANAMICAHPWRYLSLHVRPYALFPDAPALCEHLGITSAGQGTLDVLNTKGVLAAVRHYFRDRMWALAMLAPALLVVMIMYVGVAVQLVHWIRKRQWYWFVVFGAFVAYYVVLPGPVAMPRYQLPALPLLAIMAAMSYARFRKRGLTRMALR